MLGMEPSFVVGLLWFVMIGFMFFAQHHVCDAYFVPAINVFVEKMRKSDKPCLRRWGEEAVAGATICALGCNGPELFTNLISLYTGSDAGIGVVVGSEIFNLLIIIGAAIMAAPVLPLQLERVPFTRDVFFYAVSIGMLYCFLLDHVIEWHECTMLLAAAAVYVVAVYFTTDVVNCIPALKPVETAPLEDGQKPGAAPKKKGKMHGIEVHVEEIVHSRMVDGKNAGGKMDWNLDATAHGIYAEPVDAPQQEVKKPRKGARSSIGFQFDQADSMLGAVLKYKDLKEVVVKEMGVIELEFYHSFLHVTLRMTVPDADKRDELLKNIQEFSLGKAWQHGYDPTAKGALDHFLHTIKNPDEAIFEKLVALPEFLIDVVLRGTLHRCDVKDITKENKWPLCFAGAMFWLGVFSFMMLEIANEIHYNIPCLPTSFLGITVCAIGTSFPNAVASVLMSQQNKPAAAIANALGSNVQNVFLAMALPWVIYSAQHGFEPIKQNVAGISEGVFWMVATLVLVVVFVLSPGFCSLSRSNGVVLIVVYICYLVITSLETFKVISPLVN